MKFTPSRYSDEVCCRYGAARRITDAPATAHADCSDPDQPPCTGRVPMVDQVVGIMAELTDPNIPAVNKGDIVTPGFSPDEAGTIDNHLPSHGRAAHRRSPSP